MAVIAAVVILAGGLVAGVLLTSGSGPQNGQGSPGATSAPAPAPTPAPTSVPGGSAAPPPPATTQQPVPGFAYVPLWPFASVADAAAWQQSYRGGGHQPWHLDPGLTAQSFTQGYLRYTDLDVITQTSVQGDQAWVGVGYTNPNNQPTTAAVIHLAKIGSGTDAPWEVVGTRDTTLTLTQPGYGSKVSSPVTVGGRITGVDENLQVQIRTLGTGVVGRSAGIPAGGQDTPWSVTVPFAAPSGSVLTIAVATGGHVTSVERFAITGVRS
ncbi:hypothetical protein FG385_19170 [Amycolatopsis alkalitolerans]|uniref:Uncharacterized protein n=1 Tax=Amycolatopsis alkalitolerans TaxID=2547244 RepID=A0A5C4LZI9_9PSEU|nr:hypothetical protein FG385_19170 [Amycolatopsis alkalitolerans]